MKSVIRAALIGVPLPLCSCGVIPTGISIHRNGASKGAAVSFLISTPQTGIDSIMVTYSLLGLPFAIIRPIAALITGIFGGAITNRIEHVSASKPFIGDENEKTSTKTKRKPLSEIFTYAYIYLLEDIAKWLVIGLLIAALIAVLVPDDFFAMYIHNEFLGMLIILAISVPLYVCATSSVPIAAVLMMKGISPGSALIFLMAGPATNAATITVIGNAMGRRTLLTYLATIISGALFSGLFIDYFLPREWFTGAIVHIHKGHEHGLLPYWLQVFSGITISLLIVNVFVRKTIKKIKSRKELTAKNKIIMNEVKVFVRGMTCNHCKMSVETNLMKLKGVENISANLENEIVTITGENVNLDKVKETVESIGYTYDGIVE
jgi:uncharacterized membrane protein YraQ (UPF0718 family)/copper chaperone CopZ